MVLRFLRFYTLFGVLVVLRSYGFSSLFTGTRSSHKDKRVDIQGELDILLKIRFREVTIPA